MSNLPRNYQLKDRQTGSPVLELFDVDGRMTRRLAAAGAGVPTG